MSYYIGLMSGTSLDGVDLAITQCTAESCQLLLGFYYPYDTTIKETLIAIQQQPTSLADIAKLDQQLANIYADAVNSALEQTQLSAQDIAAIGCHGQTIFHEPKLGQTWQLGDPNLLAAKTGLTTVADFRRKDMALGGQGAPLVPAFHQALFSSHENRIVLNIGGIANITVLTANQPTMGYDTGPGNMLLDAWIQHKRQCAYDQDGQWAAAGSIHQPLLEQMLNAPYFAMTGPKSTGRELFNLAWIEQQLSKFQQDITDEDIACTLVELTVLSVAQAVKNHHDHGTLLVCGGGVHNQLMMQRLAANLPRFTVCSTADYGVDPDYMEAMCFAWLAYCRLHQLPGNLPSVTGAAQETLLGGVYSQ